MIDVRIQGADFEPGRQLARLEELGAGAVCSLTMAVRAAEDVSEIHVEHYAALAKSALAKIAAEAEARWALSGIILIHRHGRFAPGERLAFAAVAAGEQAAALEACGFLIEALRTRAPFWRKEMLSDGSSRWR